MSWPIVPVVFILLTELCERFAFYGFTGSLTCFFKVLGFASDTAAELTSLFGACVYVTPVLGAYIADAVLGRFATIVIFCALYILGLASVTAGAWPSLHPNLALGLVLAGLFVGVTIGAGGIKSNVVVLGADQFDLPRQATQQASFFNFFYWCINIGAAAAFLFLANVALYGLGSLVPPAYGFFVSFAIPLATFLVALAAFSAGRPLYVLRPPAGSAVGEIIHTLRAAACRGCSCRRPSRGALLLLAAVALPLAFALLVGSFFVRAGATHDALALGGLGLIIGGLALLIGCAGGGVRWLTDRPAEAEEDGANAADASGAAGVSRAGTADAVGVADAAALHVAVDGGVVDAKLADALAVVRLLPPAACVVVFWTVRLCHQRGAPHTGSARS